MSEELNPVQGMYCVVKGSGSQKCTVTMPAVCLTVYSEVPVFSFTTEDAHKRFAKVANIAGTNISRQTFDKDIEDLLRVTGKTQRAEMSLVSGDKILTYAVGQPLEEEGTGYLELTPDREGWWQHPNLEPIVESLQSYLPGFKPWLMNKDVYIAAMSARSGLL